MDGTGPVTGGYDGDTTLQVEISLNQQVLVGGKNLPLDGINTGLLNIFHLYNSLVLSVEYI